jgi:tRNA G10  N-methylase Trm11
MAEALAQSIPDAASDVTLAACAVGDSTALPLQSGSIDLVLGSPPYCTRIDYTAATRVELAILAGIVKMDLRFLGLQMMGSTRVPKFAPPADRNWGKTCAAFLDKIIKHPSKASSGYYFKNHADYFDKLYRSLRSISTVIRKDGKAVLVLQDSFYKDIHNPLADITIEMAASVGMRLIQRNNFQSKRTMGSVNRASKSYRQCYVPVESVLCFDKATRSHTNVE